MELQDKYIRFDWAVKRLLRHKANFGVLEGFLTVLIGDEIHIVEILESEGNQQTENDKFNRVDIKALNSKNEIVIIEIQNTRELYYLERILYGVAKAITEHISLGETYYKVYNPQIQISAESETKRSIFREKDKTKRSKKESAQHSKSRNKSFVMTSVSAL